MLRQVGTLSGVSRRKGFIIRRWGATNTHYEKEGEHDSSDLLSFDKVARPWGLARHAASFVHQGCPARVEMAN